MLHFIYVQWLYSPHFHWKWEQMLLCVVYGVCTFCTYYIRFRIVCQRRTRAFRYTYFISYTTSFTHSFSFRCAQKVLRTSNKAKQTNKNIHKPNLNTKMQYVCVCTLFIWIHAKRRRIKKTERLPRLRARTANKNKFERWRGFCLFYVCLCQIEREKLFISCVNKWASINPVELYWLVHVR